MALTMVTSAKFILYIYMTLVIQSFHLSEHVFQCPEGFWITEVGYGMHGNYVYIAKQTLLKSLNVLPTNFKTTSS